MSVTRLTEFEKYGVECIWLEVKLQNSSPFLVGFLYRNPSEPANWTDKFVSMMDVVWLEPKEIILMGDFSTDLSKANKPLTDVFSLFNLSQTVSSPTRVTPSSKTLIDHIYSTDIAHILETCVSNRRQRPLPHLLNLVKKRCKDSQGRTLPLNI